MQTRFNSRRVVRRSGLTLLELVMVVSILAILTALIVPGMGDHQEETRRTVARVTLQELRDVIANRYMQDMAGTVISSTLSTVGRVALPQPDRVNDVSGRITTTQIDGSTGGNVPQVHFLFVNPQYHASSTPPYVAVGDHDAQTRIGWNGPYITHKATQYPNPANARFPQDPNNSTKTWADYGFTTLYGQQGDYCLNDPWGSPYVIQLATTSHGGMPVYTAYAVSAGPNRTLDIGTWDYTGPGGTLNSGDDLALPIKVWK